MQGGDVKADRGPGPGAPRSGMISDRAGVPGRPPGGAAPAARRGRRL